MRADVTFDHSKFGFRLEGAEDTVEVLERNEADRGATEPAGRRFIGVTASVRVEYPELKGQPLESFASETFKVVAVAPSIVSGNRTGGTC